MLISLSNEIELLVELIWILNPPVSSELQFNTDKKLKKTIVCFMN